MVDYMKSLFQIQLMELGGLILEVVVSQGKSESGKANIGRVAANDPYVATNPRILGLFKYICEF